MQKIKYHFIEEEILLFFISEVPRLNMMSFYSFAIILSNMVLAIYNKLQNLRL